MFYAIIDTQTDEVLGHVETNDFDRVNTNLMLSGKHLVEDEQLVANSVEKLIQTIPLQQE